MLTAAGVRALLDAHGLRASKALGQHFLADPNTARRIVRLAQVGPGDRVLEVGPGVGSLTLALAEAGARVLAVERDRYLIPALEEALEGREQVTVVEADALSVDYGSLLGHGPWVMVSNLPYNVATPLVARLLDEAPAIERMLVMVQREVGERLVARPGQRAASPISVRVAYHAEAQLAGEVPATVFVPRPRVESVLVRIRRRAAPAVGCDPDSLFTLVRAAFAQRRKTLRRALRGLLSEATDAVIRAAGVDPRARAEQLSLEEWAALVDAWRG